MSGKSKTTTPATISDDLTRVLALARAALNARDDKRLWASDPEEAGDLHGAACNALWEELERLVRESDGKVPVLETRAQMQGRIDRRMRNEILAACQNAIVETLDDISRGTFDWED